MFNIVISAETVLHDDQCGSADVTYYNHSLKLFYILAIYSTSLSSCRSIVCMQSNFNNFVVVDNLSFS